MGSHSTPFLQECIPIVRFGPPGVWSTEWMNCIAPPSRSLPIPSPLKVKGLPACHLSLLHPPRPLSHLSPPHCFLQDQITRCFSGGRCAGYCCSYSPPGCPPNPSKTPTPTLNPTSLSPPCRFLQDWNPITRVVTLDPEGRGPSAGPLIGWLDPGQQHRMQRNHPRD